MDIAISLPTDTDGFLSQECPSCKRLFKVVFGDGSDKPVSHCPYCRHVGQQCWWTPEQAEYFASVAVESVVTPRLNSMARKFNRQQSSGFLSMRMDVKSSPPAPKPVEPDAEMSTHFFDCCGERIKHDGQTTHLFCVICGTGSGVS